MDMYDFGARYYDPTLANWHSIDPLAEGSPEWSGYNYVGDNPMNIIDPDGMQWSNGTWSGVPIGKGTAGGAAFGAGWNIASGGASAADALVNAINAYNASTPGFSKVQDFSKFGATQTAARSSIPQAWPPVQLDKSGITPDQREFIDQVTNRIVKEYNQTHGKPVHVGQYNPSTGQIQGSGAVEQLFPENGIIQAGVFLITDGLSAEAEALDGSFSISNWEGYPTVGGGLKPSGPFRLLEGSEYQEARALANKTNLTLRRSNPEFFEGYQIHEIHPVKFGGNPVDISNKMLLTPQEHRLYNNYWRIMQKLAQ